MKIKVDTKAIYLSMLEKGMNGTDLANAAGVTQQAISSLLCGRVIGKQKLLPDVCKVLELNIKDVVIIEE
ncbi:helix-turn-helix transcriptional regulator [Anaerosporobacter sp.]|uniref:helix-turn-helix transcriptional regulator n=1 Tax=Anaerosporobacter sp. TaxID=1872529 RepID=UPI00286EB588|nr:helix-turn-helix transcriptional regulator [Anaerosporobacter sp.]